MTMTNDDDDNMLLSEASAGFIGHASPSESLAGRTPL